MKYTSEYTDKKIGPAQKIAEMVCENISFRKLGPKFWNEKPWDSIYKCQLFAAYSILKMYDEELIIKTIKENKTKKLREDSFVKLLELAVKRRDNIRETVVKKTGKPHEGKVVKKGGPLSKLKEL
jgi:hypothetical protein